MGKPRIAKTRFDRRAGIGGGIGLKSRGGTHTARLKARRALRKAREKVYGTKEITLKHDEIPDYIMEPLQQKALHAFIEKGYKAAGTICLCLGIGGGIAIQNPAYKGAAVFLGAGGMTVSQIGAKTSRKFQVVDERILRHGLGLSSRQPIMESVFLSLPLRRGQGSPNQKQIEEATRKYPYLVATIKKTGSLKKDPKKPWNVFRVEEITFTDNPGMGKRRRTTQLWAT
ncbi:MAG: hypothetical protein V1493_06035 [Candidatus Diapherotrites archaeon]